jgi:hypothetical protein
MVVALGAGPEGSCTPQAVLEGCAARGETRWASREIAHRGEVGAVSPGGTTAPTSMLRGGA